MAEELTELEHCAIDTIEDAIAHLGPDHAAVKALGEDKGAAHMPGGESTDLWAPLVDALKVVVKNNRDKAHTKRNPPERVSTQAMSGRAHNRGGAGAAV